MYRPVFSEDAADVIAALSKARQRKIKPMIAALASAPHLPSDYAIRDESGRMIEHLMTEEFIFAYWIDHAAKEIRITDIEVLT